MGRSWHAGDPGDPGGDPGDPGGDPRRSGTLTAIPQCAVCLPLLPSALHTASESGAKDFALKQLSVFDTCVSVERTSDEWAIVKRNT
jgi:hypothetical protein